MTVTNMKSYEWGMGRPVLSVIPYVGGKKGLVRNINPIIHWCAETFGLKGLIEGSAGGARMMLNTNPAMFEHRILNDVDLSLCKMYAVLGDDILVYELIEKLHNLGYSEEVFNKAVLDRELDGELADRDIYERTSDWVTAAAHTYICALQSRAANMKSYDYFSEWLHRGSYFERIKGLDKFLPILSDVEVTHGDCLDLVDEYYDRSDYFMYQDMPYVPETMESENHYKYNCSREKHEILIDKMIGTKMKVASSSYASDIYDRLLDHGWSKLFLKMKHVSMGGTGRMAAEYLYINFDLPYELELKVSSILPILNNSKTMCFI
ncbi:DNA adenine methylase [Bacillus sp. FJAT-45350]|uniref:DNA adenine methylase n=1 Tax=Bacillus sp. FJAT-45350 TaxID=2011014 RepID=UPI000BB875CD|nr:DNA adenine methylase [Bacillus sp. FJAT-45350]